MNERYSSIDDIPPKTVGYFQDGRPYYGGISTPYFPLGEDSTYPGLTELMDIYPESTMQSEDLNQQSLLFTTPIELFKALWGDIYREDHPYFSRPMATRRSSIFNNSIPSMFMGNMRDRSKKWKKHFTEILQTRTE